MVVIASIVYPSGSHGNFLAAVLNTLSGVPAGNLGQITYDDTTYAAPRNFVSVHLKQQLVPDTQIIYITVAPESYLKYAAVCFNRTSSNDLIIEDFEADTFEKLKTHPIFSLFDKSLAEISGQTSGNVSRPALREWARLCLFAQGGETISKWLAGTCIENPDYIFDYEWFYNPEVLKTQCCQLLEQLGLPAVGNIDSMLPDFYRNNRYRNIDIETEKVIQAIKNKQHYSIPTTNFFQEAYIDNWLAVTYQVVPRYLENYFTNTQDIIKEYNL